MRELANAVERAIVLGDGDLIRPEDLPETLLEAGPPPGAAGVRYHEGVAEAKRRLVQDALAEAGET